jgi:hypothetical protein
MHSFIFEHRFWHDSSSNHVHSSARLVRNQEEGNVQEIQRNGDIVQL